MSELVSDNIAGLEVEDLMEVKNKQLILGYDLGSDFTRLCCYNEKSGDIDTICYVSDAFVDKIPTVLFLEQGQDQWLFGYEAYNACEQKQGILLKDFVENLEEKPEIFAEGRSFKKSELIKIFIQKSLSLVTKYYPHWEIGFLALTVQHLEHTLIETFREMPKTLGISKEQMSFQNHMTSYEYFSLNQKKELWQHDVGLFQYDRQGLYYYHLDISRKKMPITVMGSGVDLREYLDGGEYGHMSSPEIDRRFLDAVNKVVENKLLSVVYLVGEGFEEEWWNVSLKKLCHHRKVYAGQNLYATGACYYGMKEMEILAEPSFVVLNDSVLPKSISIYGTQGKELKSLELVPAGVPWYEIYKKTVVIPDKTSQIALHIRDFATGEEKSVAIDLPEIPNRPNKATRIAIELSFKNESICHVCLEDLGFGELWPATGNITETDVDIHADEVEGASEKGRLIFCKELKEKTAYLFRISEKRVYTIEELCYYLYHNIYAVSKDIFDEELLYWIEHCAKEKMISVYLRNAIRTRQSLKDMVRLVMASVDYYTNAEITKLYAIIEEIEHQNPIEAKKTEGDNFLRYKKYISALKAYQEVLYRLNDQEGDDTTKEFKGNVYHNMGTTFASLMNLKASAACFREAYALNKNQTSLEHYLIAIKLLEDKEALNKALSENYFTNNEINDIWKKIADTMTQARAGEEYRRVKHIQKLRKGADKSDYPDAVAEYMTEFKEKYRG